MPISDRIRQIARDSGLPVRQIANQAGVNLSACQRFLGGEGCSTSTLDAIADLFGVGLTRPTKRPKPTGRPVGRPPKKS